jgi:hypothetical protein
MDKKFNIGKFSIGKLFKNLSWLFFAVFLVLLVFEGLEIENSVGLVMQLNQAPQTALPKKNSLDRIDFTTYNKNLAKVQNAQNFTPSGGITYDPFNGIGTPPLPPAPATSTPIIIPIATSTPSAASGTSQ